MHHDSNLPFGIIWGWFIQLLIQLMLMHFSWGWLPHKTKPAPERNRCRQGEAAHRVPGRRFSFRFASDITWKVPEIFGRKTWQTWHLSSKLQKNVNSVVELPATMEVQTNRKGLVLFNSLADSVFDLRDSPGQASPTWIL